MRSALYYIALFFWIFLPGSSLVFGQQVSGRVTDRQGKPVAGANIFIKGTVVGTNSLPDGSFSFEFGAPGDTLLQVRHIAMYDVEMPVYITDNMPPLLIRMEEKTTQVQEVTVSADPGYTLLDGNRATVLRTMDVETTAGGDGDVIGALRTLPGVQQIGYDAALFVRGGSKEEARTIIDGLEITHPYYSGIPDLAQKSRFSPHLFEGITFNTGGYSALYGNALSSVLALSTRDHPNHSSSVVAFLLYGVKAGHDHLSADGRTSFGLDLGYSHFGPYYQWIGHQTDWIDAPVNKTANANFRQNIGSHGLLKWYGYGNLSDQEARVPELDGPGEQVELRVKNTNAVSLLTYTHQVHKDWSLYAGHGYNTNLDLIGRSWLQQQPAQEQQWHDRQHQVRVNLLGRASSRVMLNMGSEVFLNDWKTLSREVSTLRWDAWTDVRYQPATYLTARAGLRTAWNREISGEFLWMPRLNLTYHRGRHSVTAGAGLYAQQPDKEFYLDSRLTGNHFAHDYDHERSSRPGLGHARVRHYLLNYQRKYFGRTLRVEAYYKDYENLMLTVPVSRPGGSGYARGMDIFWRDPSAAEGLDYWISYSWLDTKRQYLDYPEHVQPTFAAPHTLHLVAKQFIEPLGLFVGGSYSFSSGHPYYNPNSPAFLSDHTPVYHQINFNFAFLRKWGKTFNTIVFAVNNVTGRHQIYDYRFSPDGRRRLTVDQPFRRGFLVGWFISIGQDRSTEILNQLQ